METQEPQDEQEMTREDLVLALKKLDEDMLADMRRTLTEPHEAPEEEWEISRILREHEENCRACMLGRSRTFQPRQ